MKRLIYYIFLPTLFYPAYFLGANLIDSLIGDQQLINWMYFDSRSVLLKTFLKDWSDSLPVMYVIFFFLVKPLEIISGKFFNSSKLFVYIIATIIITVASYAIGFRELGLVINASVMILIVTFVYLSRFILFSYSR